MTPIIHYTHFRKRTYEKRGFNWHGTYTFGSYYFNGLSQSFRDQWFIQFKHEHGWPIQVWETLQAFEHRWRQYQILRKSIRMCNEIPPNRPKYYKSFALYFLTPTLAYEVKEVPIQHFISTWDFHTRKQYCRKTIERLSLCYKHVLRIKMFDTAHGDWPIGIFFLFCNDKDIWSCIESELRQVFAHNVKTIE